MADSIAPSVHHSTSHLRDGRRFHTVRSGVTGQKIVFLHGYIDSWRSFERMFPFLRDYLLIAVDQRGHGETDPAATYTISDFVTDAIELLETKSDTPVHLVGHSLGALIAHRVATLRPDLVCSITLIGGAISSGQNSGLAALAHSLSDLTDPIPYEFAYEFQKSTAFQPLEGDILAAYVSESMKVGAHAWREALRGLLEDRFVAGDAPRVPTLVLWGEHDEVFPIDDQTKLRAWLRDAVFINYPDLGHAPQWEDPGRVSSDIKNFIENASR